MPGGLVFGCLLPHPPVLLPEVGGAMAGPVQPTVDAMRQVGHHIAALEPQALILLSPHGPLLADSMGIGLSPAAQGDFASFAAPGVQLSAECDVALAEALQAACARSALPLAAVDSLTGPPRELGVYRLDHGAAVPLCILLPLIGRVPVVLLGFSALPRATHRAFGQRIRDVCEASGKRVVFVASGDLSHRLTPTAPAGYDPRGQVFDDAVLAAVSAGDWNALASIPEDLVEAAGVCGYLSLLTLTGVLGDVPASSQVLSYQGTYGVGYAVAAMVPRALQVTADSVRPATEPLGRSGRPESAPFAFPEGPPGEQMLALVRATLVAYTARGDRLRLPSPVPAALSGAGACFVTLRLRGQLRGCVGTMLPVQPSLAAEIVENAIGAASRDPRFLPLHASELPALSCSVDVLTRPEPIAGLDALDPQRYGLVVVQQDRVGLLLPELPEITTVDAQYRACLQKAGITNPTNVALYRFEVTRYAEGEPPRDAEH